MKSVKLQIWDHVINNTLFKMYNITNLNDLHTIYFTTYHQCKTNNIKDLIVHSINASQYHTINK